jgi:hypothetical protein
LDRPKRWLLGCALEGISNGNSDDGWMFVGELSIPPTSWDQQARTLDFVGIHDRQNLSCKQIRQNLPTLIMKARQFLLNLLSKKTAENPMQLTVAIQYKWKVPSIEYQCPLQP